MLGLKIGQTGVDPTVLGEGASRIVMHCIQLALTLKHEKTNTGSITGQLTVLLGSHLTSSTDEVGEESWIALGKGQTFLVRKSSLKGSARLVALGPGRCFHRSRFCLCRAEKLVSRRQVPTS